MSELIEKVSAYDLLNSLIPGGILVYFMGVLGYLDISSTNAFFLCVFAYVLGVVGSYISAEKNDEKLSALTTVSNMYRSLAGSLVVLALLSLGSLIPEIHRCWLLLIYGVLCFVLFLASWLKQERYIAKRITINKGGLDDNN